LGNTTSNYIGKSQFSADAYFRGAIDDFKIHNYILSAGEIQMLARKPQVITFENFEPRRIGDGRTAIVASASSGLPVSFAVSDTTIAYIYGDTLYFKSAGLVEVTAAQEGNEYYLSADSVTRQLSINTLYYVDADRDGFGSKVEAWIPSRQAPFGFSSDSVDCDDLLLTYTDSDGDGLGIGALVPCGVDNNKDCDDTNSQQLNVVIPVAYALPSGARKNTVYVGYAPASSLTLKPVVSGGTGPYTYQWSTGHTSSQLVVNSAGLYAVIVRDSKGCAAYPGIDIPLRADSTITLPEGTGVSVVSQNVQCGPGNKKVSVCHVQTSVSSCVALPAAKPLLNNGWQLGDCTVANESGDGELSAYMYPNPARDEINFQLSQSYASVTIRFFRWDGREVSHLVAGQQGNFAIHNLPFGLYHVTISDGVRTVVRRFIKI
jgi:hypothetical protein